MSVLVRNRKESRFEPFHHLAKLRRDITDLLLRDFGYSENKAEKRLRKMFRDRPYKDLNEQEKFHYDRVRKRDEAFHNWFMVDQRKEIVDCLRTIQTNITLANSLVPTVREELLKRRMYQDEAIGYCYCLVQELQYAIETLPVDVNVFLRFGEGIQTEISLIEKWRDRDIKEFGHFL